MDAVIEKDISGNKIIMNCRYMDYKVRMLEMNNIPGFLSVSVLEDDGQVKLKYDISSMVSLSDAMNARSLGSEELKNIIYSMSHILTVTSQFLLSASDLIIDSRYIYVKTPQMDPYVCCLPGFGGNYQAQFSSLLRELLGAVDQRDKDAVVLAYSLYQESLRDGYVMADIIRVLAEDSYGLHPEQKLKIAESAAIDYPEEEEQYKAPKKKHKLFGR